MDLTSIEINNAIFYDNKQKYFTFTCILFINTLFFSGYYILKVPFALILNSEGVPLNEAYSINTTASTLLAICSVYFGVTLHKCAKKIFSLYIGLLFCVISIFILSLKIYSLITLAVALYVLGGGLYFFNLVMFINKQFENAQSRIKGNFLYLIFVNIAGVVGCLLFLSQIHQANVFKYCLISTICALILFTLLYPKMDTDKDEKNKLLSFFGYLLVLFLLILMTLQHTEVMRWLVILTFVFASCYALHLFSHEKDTKLLLFLSLVYLFNIPYWIANTLIYNEFIYFVSNSVSPFWGFSPMLLMLIDPLVNVLFGTLILFWFKKRLIHKHNLSASIFLMGLAFATLVFGLFINENLHHLSIFFPLTTMILFAWAEFLLQSTLNSRVRDLLSKNSRDEFLGTGILRSSRAFSHVIGYYLITLTITKNHIKNHQVIILNLHLYLSMAAIIIVSILGFAVLRKSKLGELL